MMPIETLTAANILAIPPGEPERLFSPGAGALRAEFTALVKRWHPDRNAGSAEAAQVFTRILTLRSAALAKLSGHASPDPSVLKIETRDGRTFEFKAKRRHPFELGEMVIAERRVAFMVDQAHESLFRAGLRRIETIVYPDDAVRHEVARFLPTVERVLATPASRIAILGKSENAVLLKDLLDHLGGQLPPKHVAWVVSSLLNLACFFAATGLTHNALSTATVFVAPKHHAAYLLGGWWYAAPAGARLTMLPAETHALMPPSIAAGKRADIRLDLESIRAIARVCLGDPTGVELVGRTDVPRPMADFFRLPSSGSALEDYRTWDQVLRESFGPRRFVDLPVSASDVYP